MVYMCMISCRVDLEWKNESVSPVLSMEYTALEKWIDWQIKLNAEVKINILRWSYNH